MAFIEKEIEPKKKSDSGVRVRSRVVVGGGAPHEQPLPTAKKQGIKRERLFTVLAFLLVLSIVGGTFFGAVRATPYIKYNDIVNFTG